jgi:D-alanyl-D-alanine carboxypeptidase/Putative peptidoglycan binding domain
VTREEQELNPLFGARCERTRHIPVVVFGVTLPFAPRGANQLLRAAINAYDVRYRVRRIESFNCRKKTSGRGWSTHAWPVAVDINPDQNPFSSDGMLRTDMPRAFVEAFTIEGFGWGGNWRGAKDAMHFSLAPHERGRPRPQPFDPNLQRRAIRRWRELHRGVEIPPPSPRRGGRGEPAPAYPGYVMSRARWMRTRRADANVRRFQRRLHQRGWRVEADGRFTLAAERVVRAFQREKRLLVDGKVGPATWRQIWEAPVTHL